MTHVHVAVVKSTNSAVAKIKKETFTNQNKRFTIIENETEIDIVNTKMRRVSCEMQQREMPQGRKAELVS